MRTGKRKFCGKTEYTCPGRLKEKMSSKRAMTLTEMLASLLIMSMVTLVIAGGVMSVKSAYEKTMDKADAQQVLATTVELMTDELSGAMQEETTGTGKVVFLSGKGSGWIWFGWDKERGICRIPEDGDTESGEPLLSSGAMAGKFITKFGSLEYEKACFTVKNIAVYEKAAAESGSPVAVLPELKVRAVNLEEQ